MPTLLLINGPPGVGKSTLARRWVDDRPLACRLDVDEVRALLGQWESDPHEAGLRARAMALAMAAAHLPAGYDVVVPQLVARPPFADELAAVAASAGATFREVVLTAGDAVARGASRDPDIAATVARLAAYVATRPAAITVAVRAGDVDGTYRDLAAAVRGA